MSGATRVSVRTLACEHRSGLKGLYQLQFHNLVLREGVPSAPVFYFRSEV